MAEVLRIKEVMQKALTGKRCLVVLDEMFRGTNAKDAFEASLAVNELLKRFSCCHFLISTHILEYAKAFEKDPACCFYYMEAEIIDDAFVCHHFFYTKNLCHEMASPVTQRVRQINRSINTFVKRTNH